MITLKMCSYLVMLYQKMMYTLLEYSFLTIIDKHQHIHIFTFKTVLV